MVKIWFILKWIRKIWFSCFTFKGQCYADLDFDYARNTVEKVVYVKKEITSEKILKSFYELIKKPVKTSKNQNGDANGDANKNAE